MYKMEIIPAKGKISSLSTTSHDVKVISPGSTVKITLAKSDIVGVKQIDDSLVILQKNGENITLEEFFKAGAEKNKLVIDDGGVLYQAQYDVDNFAGMNFTKSPGAEEIVSEGADAPLAGWVVPAILGAIGVAGAGALIASKSGGGSQPKSSDSSAESSEINDGQLTQAQVDLANSKSALDQVALQAEAALKALSNSPDSTTQTAATHADAALKAAVTAYQQSYQQLSDAVKTASAKGIDTKNAEAVLKQMSNASENTEALAEKLAGTQQAVKALLAMQTPELSELTSAAQTAASLAKTHPNQTNIDAAQARLDALKTVLTPANEALQQAIATAESLGVDTANIKAAGDTIYQSVLNSIDEALSEARENLETLNAANTAIEQANAAVKFAEQARASAAGKLEAALAAKKQALDNNQHDRVENVNKAIKEANQAVEEARTAADAANELVKNANESIDRIKAEVADKPGHLDTVEMNALDTIDKGLSDEQPKSILEAITDFGKNLIAVVTDIADQIKGSTLVKMISDFIGKTMDTVEGVPGMLWDMVSAPFAAMGTVTKSIIKLFTDVKADIWDVITTVIDTAKDIVFSPFADVAKGIMTGISDAVSEMGLFDWINPTKWIALAKDVVVNSFNNAVEALWNSVTSIPGKIIDAIGDVIGTVTEGIAQDLQTIKTGFQDVIDIFFEAFIKNPFELLVKPLFEDMSSLLSDPLGAINNIITTIGTIFKEGVDIIKSLFEAPGKAFDTIKELFSDAIKSFSDGKVTEISIDDINAVVKATQDVLSSQEIKNTESTETPLVKSLLESFSAKNGDINLDDIVPEGTGHTLNDNNGNEHVSEVVVQTFILHEDVIDTAVIS